ncbi:uncharacterized protein VTP21DRAFT_1318 [Calcarisporiella thermophila]|uniref:uncharacterized protein n=1 Tax=Calcarisporiella thermophila TaxID=911321 RepID=UPI003742655A
MPVSTKLLLWAGIPVAGAATYGVLRRRLNSDADQRFMMHAKGEEMTKLQQEWHKKNQGLGLRDVGRSGGGV